MKTDFSGRMALFFTSCYLMAGVQSANCQTNFTILKSFSTASNFISAGVLPLCGVIQASDGWLYGVAGAGGTNAPGFGGGTVFRLQTNGSGFNVLKDLSLTNGVTPYGSLLEASDGMLYGTTYTGGISNYGTVYRLSKNGSDFTVLHHFAGGSDSKNPYAALIEGDDGFLYGTTYFGNSATRGTVFKVDKSGSNYAIIHTFTGNPDGQQPVARLLKSGGKLYGTTVFGGLSTAGTIFEMNQDGSDYGYLYFFASGNGGYAPDHGLIKGSDGMYYGSTQSGGSGGGGTIYRLNRANLDYTVIHSFTNSGDALRGTSGELVEGSDGFLYGGAFDGGVGDRGGIFRLKKDGSEYSVVRSFASTGGDGERPLMALFKSDDGLFYGATQYGGKAGVGCVFALSAMPLGPRMLTHSMSGSSSIIQFSGTAAAQYTIQISSNLSTWSNLTTAVAPNHGEIVFTNIAPPHPAGFYRVRL